MGAACRKCRDALLRNGLRQTSLGAACRKCRDALLRNGLRQTSLISVGSSEASQGELRTEMSNRQVAAHVREGPLQRPHFLPAPLSVYGETAARPRPSTDTAVFYSFDETAAIQAMSFKRTSLRRRSRGGLAPSCARKKVPSSNTNHISQYRWLEELLARVTRGEAREAARVEDTQVPATPLFVVAGACPNTVCGMQAVMYSLLEESVAFWWIKPQERDSNALERSTLHLHSKGPFKNAAARAKAAYEPLAQRFQGVVDGDFAFGVDRESGRAFIDEHDGRGTMRRMLLYFVWQESWSNMMCRRRFIKGKLCYQRNSLERYFARQYKIQDGHLFIMESETEEAMDTLLPPDSFQDLFETSD